MTTSNIEISGRQVGPGFPTYIIAELSANHHQGLDEAIRLIHAAKDVGADAVKLQTYTPDSMTISSENPEFQINEGLWEGRQLYELYEQAHTPWEWHAELKREAENLGLHLFSSPFDCTAVDFLEEMGVPVYKVASFEIIDIPLVRHIARQGKPIIMSTGMATLAEIEEAVTVIHAEGNRQLVILHCISAYPASPENMNLRTIPHLSQAFGVPTGLSDHTLGIAMPVGAVALGACVIEKHFTMDRSAGGLDSAFSLEPEEFRQMVTNIRDLEHGLGTVRYGPTEGEKAMLPLRRSLYVVEDIEQDEPLTAKNVRSIRPGLGLHPRHLPEVLGRMAGRRVSRGTPLDWGMIASDA